MYLWLSIPLAALPKQSYVDQNTEAAIANFTRSYSLRGILSLSGFESELASKQFTTRRLILV